MSATGGGGVVVFVPEDPGAADSLAKKGALAFDFGGFWSKGFSMGTGQAHVKRYNRFLGKINESGKAKPSFIVSHELSLEDAPAAYAHFNARDDGWTKDILKPGKLRKTREPQQNRCKNCHSRRSENG